MRRTTWLMATACLALGCSEGERAQEVQLLQDSGPTVAPALGAPGRGAIGEAFGSGTGGGGGGGIGGVGNGDVSGVMRGVATSSAAKREEALRMRRGAPAPEAPPAPVAFTVRQGAASMPAQSPNASTRVDAQAGSPSVMPAMIIRTGNATLEVQQIDPAVARIRVLAQQLGGFVANTSLQGGREQIRTATLELKIPAARFDEAISGLNPVGKVESVNIAAEDVGEEYVDVSARVANARRLEERLVRLLATQTGKLQEVLSVERELARVREEIERYEGRLRYLQTRSAVSTLAVNLHEPFPIIAGAPGRGPIADAFRQAWRNFVGFVAWGIAASGVLVPLLVLATLLVLAWRRWGPRLDRGTRTSILMRTSAEPGAGD